MSLPRKNRQALIDQGLEELMGLAQTGSSRGLQVVRHDAEPADVVAASALIEAVSEPLVGEGDEATTKTEPVEVAKSVPLAAPAKGSSNPAKQGRAKNKLSPASSVTGRHLRTVRIDNELYEQIQRCLYWLSGPPHRLSPQRFYDEALQTYVRTLQNNHNDEKPFPEIP